MTNQELCKRHDELFKEYLKNKSEEVWKEIIGIRNELDKRDTDAFVKWCMSGGQPIANFFK